MQLLHSMERQQLPLVDWLLGSLLRLLSPRALLLAEVLLFQWLLPLLLVVQQVLLLLVHMPKLCVRPAGPA